uniref:KIAA0825 n=1 Tax=Salmo trutta TaxID=8032 RepID=A0A673WB82_SALTR
MRRNIFKLPLVSGRMEWQGDLPQDHAFVELLLPGLPSELDIQQLLRDTEDKLKLNACSIEQNLKELQGKMGESWTGEHPPSPTECLQWFNPRNNSTVRPVATGNQELLDFLKALLQYLRTEEEGREDVTLQLLHNISSQCGVSFPNTTPSPILQQPGPSAHTSVHTVRDDSALESHEVWDEVRLRLRRHLLDRLSCPLPVPQRIYCLQQLFFLYPEWEVLMHYQGLRSQAVLSLLHSALASSPGGKETGFDRLALGLRAAAPALCSALREELLVLNGVAKPHTILGFLNAAYLNTVSQELGAMMEREFENALKDNTTLSGGKGRKSSARTKATVAPLELPPRRGRNFSLTSHQLRVLTQLACTLLGLESQVDELATQLAFINCAGETPCGVRGILKKTKDDLDMTTVDGNKTTAETLFQSPETVVLEFDWRAAFRKLVPHMAHCVKVVLEDVCTKSLQQEELSHTSGSAHMVLTNTPHRDDSSLTCPERDRPKMVAKFCGDIMGECDALLPLAEACGDAALLEVRCSFVEVCAWVTSAILGRVEERAGEVPSAAPLKNLIALLGTSMYIHQRLCHYEAQLRETNTTAARVPMTLLPIQRYQDVTEGLREQLASYCVQVCTSTILQDAESHHWADPKPFYEGDRCSFSVQMWHYFLTGLRTDLWLAVPGSVGRDVLAQVTSESLQVLVQRYSRARPSYKRHLQIRTFQYRPGEGSAPALAHSPGSPGIHWLSAIHPGLFTQQAAREGLADEATSECQLRLLTSDPRCSPRLLLTAILHRDCHLLRVLLEHSHFCMEEEADADAVSPVKSDAGDEFMEAMYNVLSSLNNFPKALTLALETYFDRGHLWDYLYSLADSVRPVPVVISFIRAVVNQPVHCLLGHLVTMVLAWQASEEPFSPLLRRDVPDNILTKVPKEWSYTLQTPKGRESAKSVVNLALQALSFIYTNLPSAVASLPLPVRFLFHTAEKHLSQHARQLRSTGLLLWALLSCLCQCLEDPNSLELLCGLPLDRGAKERLALLSECLQGTIGQGQQKGVPKPTVHKVLQALEERRPKWCSMQLQKARKLCSESAFEWGESGVPQEGGGGVAEATEQKIGLILLEICHKPGGSEYLRQIYHIIQVNEPLLRSKLCVSSDPPIDSPQTVTFDLGTDRPGRPGHPSPRFNPLHQFNHIGSSKFDQAAVGDWAWDWATLLPTYKGMSQVTLRALLANRWEMQDGAALEDEEKPLVEELQKAYFNQSPGSQGPPRSHPGSPG